MTVGTKSVLFGAHCFLIHGFFVARGWWTLWGFPWDPRLWTAFFVHDLGYLGCGDMDGSQGEEHVQLGAKIMSLQRLADATVQSIRDDSGAASLEEAFLQVLGQSEGIS